MIPFNKPYYTEKTHEAIRQAALAGGQLSAGGMFTRRCERLLEDRYGFGRCFLTTSCTSALEMAAMLCGISPGDEVILPSYTFVSTALAFARAGAALRFVDSLPSDPNMDCSRIESLITPRTKAIVAVHYAGVECDMAAVGDLARRYGLRVVEDAAHAINTAAGHRGDLSCFSFHETKNIHCGEGGMLAINDPSLIPLAETVWAKGTDRAMFERGETGKYEWVSQGGAFGMPELSAVLLYTNLNDADLIQPHRDSLWEHYRQTLAPLASKGYFTTAQHQANSHIFYIVCRSGAERSALIDWLRSKGITAVFHYQSLHRSPYGSRFHDGRDLPNADRYSECLLRLPLFHDLSKFQVEHITGAIAAFYE